MSTADPAASSAITAVLLKITQHAEQIAALDEREATRYQHITAQLSELGRQLADTRDRLTAAAAATDRHAALLDALNGLDQHVAALATRVTQIAASGGDGGGDSYQPDSAPRWWVLYGTEREASLARLRAWVDQIYRPGYGHLASVLGACWEQHPLCLYGLDWLMELWSALYLIPERRVDTLASQAEWQSRLLPALAAQMHAETSRCQHSPSSSRLRLPASPDGRAPKPPPAAGRS
jgi:hypothetical protein